MKELSDHLQKEEKRRDATQAELDKVNRVLLNAKAGIEHLASKVQHIKLVSAKWLLFAVTNCLCLELGLSVC